MDNYKGPFDKATDIAPAGGVQSGVPLVVGNSFRIPQADAAEGEQYAYLTAGRFLLPLGSGVTFAKGDSAYFDAVAGKMTTDNTKLPVGTSCEVTAGTEATVEIDVFPAGVNDTELAGKADKDVDAVENNFAKFDASGNPVDAGVSESDFAGADHNHDADYAAPADLPLAGTVTITGTDTTAAVAFGAELADTDYAIMLTQGAPTGSAVGSEAPWYTAKATTGFTVNIATAPGGTDTTEIDWIAVPLRNPA